MQAYAAVRAGIHGVALVVADTALSAGSLPPAGAEAGTLTVMCGGDPAVFERARPVIDAYARINELLNWQVASTGEAISMADAAATKVFSTERIQTVCRMVDEIIRRYGDFADPETAALVNWLDVQQKRHVVITFGGGVNEVMRDMIATSGLGLPRAKR